MWRSDRGAWFDWDLINHKNQDCFFVSNIVPLWTGSYNMPKDAVANDVLNYLRDEGIVEPDFSISFHGIIIIVAHSNILKRLNHIYIIRFSYICRFYT
jgi:hypothetical protein